MEYALSFPKIEYQMNNIKNVRQSRKCPDYDIEWLPAMKNSSLTALKGVHCANNKAQHEGTPRQVGVR
jgi:hypothetical protein